MTIIKNVLKRICVCASIFLKLGYRIVLTIKNAIKSIRGGIKSHMNLQFSADIIKTREAITEAAAGTGKPTKSCILACLSDEGSNGCVITLNLARRTPAQRR